MKKGTLFILVMVLLTSSLLAQDSIPMRSSFVFRDGFYRNIQEWQTNRPSFPWKGTRMLGVMQFVNQQVELKAVQLPNGKMLPLDSLWGLCWNGRPFIRIPRDSINRELAIFTRLYYLGNISYYKYETEITREIEITAYNPLNGLPFRKGKVKREFKEQKEKLLRYKTGEIGTFTPEVLAKWTADLPEISRAVRLIQPDDPKDRMYRAILAFNERKPVYVRLILPNKKH
jgi:hypothetical protein